MTKKLKVITEGPEAAQRFEQTIERLLRVSKDELSRREAAYQGARAKTKTRRPTKK